MTEIFKITETSSENIQSFIETIEDNDLKDIIRNHWQEIIAVGKLENTSEKSQQLRSSFFDNIRNVIVKKMEENNEN